MKNYSFILQNTSQFYNLKKVCIYCLFWKTSKSYCKLYSIRGGMILMLWVKKMKNCTSKGKFFILFDFHTFYSKIHYFPERIIYSFYIPNKLFSKGGGVAIVFQENIHPWQIMITNIKFFSQESGRIDFTLGSQCSIVFLSLVSQT